MAIARPSHRPQTVEDSRLAVERGIPARTPQRTGLSGLDTLSLAVFVRARETGAAAGRYITSNWRGINGAPYAAHGAACLVL